MCKLFFLYILFFCIFTINAQEISALVSINSRKVQSTNKQVYKTLQKALTEFINQKEWTNKKYKPQERINCAFTIIVNSQSNNQFSASIQVQATRPVYNSTYATPIFNSKDNNFDFSYNEFDPLIYNPTRFDSNLVSTIAFYVYVILGVDGDSFALNGGNIYLRKAQNILLQAQQESSSGWKNQVGKINRFTLIDNLLSPKLKEFKTIWYNYHRKGLDFFTLNAKEAKQKIENSIIHLGNLYNKTLENYLIRLFLDAKSDEIVNIFSDRSSTLNKQKMIEVLQKISPSNKNKWQKIN